MYNIYTTLSSSCMVIDSQNYVMLNYIWMNFIALDSGIFRTPPRRYTKGLSRNS